MRNVYGILDGLTVFEHGGWHYIGYYNTTYGMTYLFERFRSYEDAAKAYRDISEGRR